MSVVAVGDVVVAGGVAAVVIVVVDELLPSL